MGQTEIFMALMEEHIWHIGLWGIIFIIYTQYSRTPQTEILRKKVGKKSLCV